MYDRGSFGFIRPDDHGPDMFVLPNQCSAFGGKLPPLGTRMVYSVVNDTKTKRDRADEVVAEDAHLAQMGIMNPYPKLSDEARDTVPRGVVLFAAKMRQAEVNGAIAAKQTQDQVEQFHSQILGEGWVAGTMGKNQEKFGFITQDNGKGDMFVMPKQCTGFAGQFPPEGARVIFNVVMDATTSKPRAENVQPEPTGFSALITSLGMASMLGNNPAGEAAVGDAQKVAENAGQEGVAVARLPMVSESHQQAAVTGVMKMAHESGMFGFIAQDSGSEDLMVMADQCGALGGKLPPVQTPVIYNVGVDNLGKACAQNVQLNVAKMTLMGQEVPAFPSNNTNDMMSTFMSLFQQQQAQGGTPDTTALQAQLQTFQGKGRSAPY